MNGAAQEAANPASHPVINAGDGTGQHPTQALLDVYTILKEHGHIEGLKVAVLGDLKYGRAPHSLVYLLKHYGCDMIFVSPPQLMMPEEITAELRGEGIKVEETGDLKDRRGRGRCPLCHTCPTGALPQQGGIRTRQG